MPWNGGGPLVEVRVTVTNYFGMNVLKDRTLLLEEGSDAMRALQEAAEVRTAYGGGFIQAVDGLESAYGAGGSGARLDWFFYVTGHMADVGASAYVLRDGDRLIFDYHRWDYSMFTPALAGCFPRDLLRGYGGGFASCRVIYSRGWEDEAKGLARALGEAGGECAVEELEDGWSPRGGVLEVVLGPWEELVAVPTLAEAMRERRARGIYAYFDRGELVILDQCGRESLRIGEGAGLVTCTGPRLGEGGVLLITGIDREGTERALEGLREQAEAQEPLMTMAWTDGLMLPVPAVEGL